MLRRQKRPCAIHSSLHFIEHQERSVLATECLCRAKILPRRHPDARFRLNRLDDEPSEFLAGQLLFESAYVIEWNGFSLGKHRTKPFTPERISHQRKGATREPVKCTIRVQQPVPPGM